ncbi:MAG: hypothetical protein AB7T49_13555 [Oligoflexales bacterium]
MKIAIMKRLIVFVAVMFTLVPSAFAKESKIEAEDKYSLFWDTRKTRNEATKEQKKTHLENSKQGLEDRWTKEIKEASLADEQELNDLASKYREEINSARNEDVRFNLRLNLAIVLARIAMLFPGQMEKIHYLEEALKITEKINAEDRNNENRDKSLYLQAAILADLDRESDAVEVWGKLAQEEFESVFRWKALVEVGDYHFRRDNFSSALKFYESAKKIGRDLWEETDRLRMVEYRAAWASYYSSDAKKVIVNCLPLFSQQDYIISDFKERKLVKEDAVELIAWAFFHLDDLNYTKASFNRQEIKPYSVKISIEVMKRYTDKREFEKAGEIGEYVYNKNSLDPDSPQLLSELQELYEKADELEKRNVVWKRLADMLVKSSVWRVKNKETIEKVVAMEELSDKAAHQLADFYFERGNKTGSPEDYAEAASVLELVTQNPLPGKNEDADLLRLGHSYYYAGQFGKASEVYANVKSKSGSNGSLPQIAAYQSVLASEKIWRESFAQAAQAGKVPAGDKVILEKLATLERNVADYVSRYGSTLSQSVDLVLMAAAANSDHERHDRAVSLWSDSLAMKPNAFQRSIAIRSILMETVERGDNDLVIKRAMAFLRSEEWNAVSVDLQKEVLGILGKATLDKAGMLADLGKAKEAGDLLLSVGSEFEGIYQREKILRDGGYMLAMAGDWDIAKDTADIYLANKDYEKYRPDMLYLKGRSFESMIQFDSAANTFINLAQKYPGYDKSESGLMRAEKLAIADDDYPTAARATIILATRPEYKQCKEDCFLRAIAYYQKANNHGEAIAAAGKMLASKMSIAARLKGEFLLARSQTYSGKRNLGHQTLERMVKKLEANRSALASDEYKEIAGELYFTLGEEDRLRLESIALNKKSGNSRERIRQKMDLFERAVAYYEKAAATRHPTWFSKSNFIVGEAAEKLANEISSVSSKSEVIPSQVAIELKNTVVSLANMSRQFYSANVLAEKKDPDQFRENLWVKKSQVRLAEAGSDRRISTSSAFELPWIMSNSANNLWSL